MIVTRQLSGEIMEFPFPSIPLNLIILLSILVAERYIALPADYHPLTFFNFIATKMGEKLIRRKSSTQQLVLSGGLATTLLLFPVVTIGAVLEWISEEPIAIDALILFACIKWTPFKKDIQRIATAVKKGYKTLAREQLSHWVLRDTNVLTDYGINKACIETLLLRTSKYVIGVSFYYLCFGAIFALTYRLLIELSMVWSEKDPRYQAFGKTIGHTVRFLDFIPSRIFAISVAMLRKFSASIRLIKQTRQHWPFSNSRWIFATAAASLPVELGGPAIYHGEKVRRQRIGTIRATTEHVTLSIAIVEQVINTWLLVFLMIIATAMAIDFFA